MEDLPQTGAAGPVPERADAARNRARVLAAARRLFAQRGIDNVSMDDVAAAAGVGKGTLYRRFGDRSGLARALLDDAERTLQEGFIRGPAPLGPGAPAAERLAAFLDALAELVDQHLDLLAASEEHGGRYRVAVFGAYHAHVAILLRELCPGADADWLAYALLSPLASDLHRHLRREREWELARVKEGLRELSARVTAG